MVGSLLEPVACIIPAEATFDSFVVFIAITVHPG